jgi:hypothetical protein
MASSVEYGIIALLVGVVIIGAVSSLEPQIRDVINEDRAEAPSAEIVEVEPGRFQLKDRPSSPILVMTPVGPRVECPQGYLMSEAARPVDAPQAFGCKEE